MNSPAKYHSRTTSGSSMPSRTGGGESVSEGGSEATPLPAQDAQAWDQHDQLQQQKLRRRRGSLRKAAMFGRGAAQRDPRRLEQSALPPLQAPQPQIQPQTQPQIPKTTPSAVSAAAAAIPPPADDYAGIVSPGSPSTTTAAGLGISDITPRASMDDYASRAASAAAAAALLSPTAKAAAAAKFYVSPRSSTDGNEDATATTTTTTTTASGVRRHGRNRSSSGSISYLGKPDDDGPLLSPTRGGGGGGGSSSGTTSTTTAAATTTTATGKSAAAAAAVAATTSLRAAHAAPQATAPLPKPAPRRLSQSSVSSSSLPTGPRIPERLPEQPERTSAAVHQPPPPTPARAQSSGQPHHAVRQAAGVPSVPTVPSQHARQQIHSLLQDQQVPPAAHAHHSYVRSHTHAHAHAHAHARSHLTMQPPPPKQRAKSPLALSDLASPLPSASASSSSATTTTNGVGVGVGVGVGGVTMTTAAAAAAAADAGWDYAETAWWGWVMLIVTWVVFVTGMGSCLGVWSWAWDVGTTPYAPPELEDDPTLPIVGYYPALIILTSVMAWVWVVVAWIGMKYFKHAKISGD